jgi:hypothetical protein
MTSVIVVGTPEKVSEFANAMVVGGYYINIIKKTKNNAAYIVIYDTAAPFVAPFSLMENGHKILLESGGRIIL